jgi:cytochrome oxidase Cu insertion factor (SCO1/SenC/PrrC family)
VANRLAEEGSERPGAALVALAVIVVVTAVWWALALWPAGPSQPMWLIRTRVACFGAMPGGLPDAGGWILLIGEPLGMLGMLLALWGRSLRRDLERAFRQGPIRNTAAALGAFALLGAVWLGSRVARAWATEHAVAVDVIGAPLRVNRAAPGMAFVDQHGRRTTFADFHSPTTLITFAYGHCSTVCPSIVNDLRSARVAANRSSVPIVIVTIDPWRDTPDRLSTLAEHWALGPNDRVLSGTIADVEAALDSLGVARRRNETTGDVDHGTSVMVLDDRGRIAWRVDGGPGAIATLLRAGT